MNYVRLAFIAFVLGFLFSLSKMTPSAYPQDFQKQNVTHIDGMEIRSTSIIFKDGEEWVAVLSWDHEEVQFEGNWDEPAKQFFTFWYQNYIENMSHFCKSVYPCESNSDLRERLKGILEE